MPGIIAPKLANRLFYLFPTYLWRWALFGALVAPLSTPVATGDFWVVKLQQTFGGLLFGISCAVVFSILQNAVNTPRKRWLSWLTVIGTWMVMKFFFAFISGALGAA